jgi:hypothetical protein
MDSTLRKTCKESLEWAKEFSEKAHPENIYERLLCRIECLEGLLQQTMYYLANAEEVAKGKK